jgi:glycosidase
MADFGYDISNYREVNPIFGTMSDFDLMLAEAHRLGLRVLLDFVPNHTSDQHDWFQRSEDGEWPYSEYYVWADAPPGGGPPCNWLSKVGGGPGSLYVGRVESVLVVIQSMKGPKVRSSAWSWSEKRGQFYYHQYQAAQPDLNYRSQFVLDEMKGVLDFWLDKGIDGVQRYLQCEQPAVARCAWTRCPTWWRGWSGGTSRGAGRRRTPGTGGSWRVGRSSRAAAGTSTTSTPTTSRRPGRS